MDWHQKEFKIPEIKLLQSKQVFQKCFFWNPRLMGHRTQCAVAFFNQNQKTQKVWWFFWVNTYYTNQNLSKKPSVNRAAKILQPKNHFLSDLLKNPKGGPFYVKKILISDFAQISCVEFLGPKYIKFWVSSKSEMKNFLT